MTTLADQPSWGKPVAGPITVWWSPTCTVHELRRAGAGFLPPQPALPNDFWDQPDNLQAVIDYLQEDPHGDQTDLAWKVAEPVTEEELRAVHDPTYVAATLSNPDAVSVRAALHAVGAAQAATFDVLNQRARASYALVTPSGHHAAYAGRGRPGDVVEFCSGAVAALRHRRVTRVSIIDVDVHHGNGAQDIFWTSPDVLTVSLHGWRNWAPGTGGQDAVGGGDGLGTNINLPLPWGSGGPTYEAAMSEVVAPALDVFRPDLIVVAAGYDGGFTDPSGRMSLCSRDFHSIGQTLRRWADSNDCLGVVLTHEGGYSPSYVPILTAGFINGLGGGPPPTDPFLAHWRPNFAPPMSKEAEDVIDRGRSALALLASR